MGKLKESMTKHQTRPSIFGKLLYEKHVRVLDYSNLTVSQQFSYPVKLKFKWKFILIEI